MVLNPGARLGPYEIQGLLGKGGMGEVYRARDTRLDRTVAIKVLPADFSENRDRRLRFEREARIIASLNHPHICSLHDIGRGDDVDFLVLEYLEAHTLSERLLRGPLTLDEALRYAVQIADALDHAHRRGIVHRDLKPGNIMVASSGIKVLDFGLGTLRPIDALPAVDTAGADPPITAANAVLGTLQYMAPEQLEGREADARTDIFAFGALVYEMATRRRPFAESTQAATVGAILHKDPPPLSELRPEAPAAMDRVIARCLAKDPENRWQTARDLMHELKWIAEGRSPRPSRPGSRGRRQLMIAAATVLTAIGLLAVGARLRPTAEEPRIVHLSVIPSANTSDFALSPDGSFIAFVTTGADTRIWIQPLDSTAARPLDGTEGAAAPFWSPDSRHIAFGARSELRKIAVSGGPVVRICDARALIGGSWNVHDVIVFTPDNRRPIYRVSARGGEAVPVTALDESLGQNTHRWPYFLPDGRHFLYLARGVRPDQNGIFIGSLDTRSAMPVVEANSRMAYTHSGYLLFAQNGTLVGQRFDAGARTLTGEPVEVLDEIRYSTADGSAGFSVSQHGELAYQTSASGPQSALAWLNRAGERVDLPVVPGNAVEPSIAPDGRRLAAMEWKNATSDIMQVELPHGGVSRITSHPAVDFAPVWSPTGKAVVFGSNREGPSDLYRTVAGVVDVDEPLLKSGAVKHATDWSADGRIIVYQAYDPETQWDIWTVDARSGGTGAPFLRSPFSERLGRLSFDGRWMAYVSDESGSDEVYVRPFSASPEQWLVSSAGGTEPRWRRDGQELFYLDSTQYIVSVPLSVGREFGHSNPRPLFRVRMVDDRVWGYDVMPDGERFIVALDVGASAPTPIGIILNWTLGLAR